MARKRKKKGKKKSSGEILVVKSKVREYIKDIGDYNVGSGLASAISERVETMISDAARRASDNGRKTIQARDV